MRRLILAASIAALVGCSSGSIDPATTAAIPEQGGSAVRIQAVDGLGSGVYIGNGAVITAAHVVGDNAKVTLISDTGEATAGDVLWRSKEYDIALVRPSRPAAFTAASVTCRAPVVGESLTAVGNPAGLEFVTMRGYVADRPHPAGVWADVFSMDVTTIAGMSGGPVYDAAGDVVGITVGTMVSAVPTNGLPAQGGLGTAVPMRTVCGLLGREVV